MPFNGSGVFQRVRNWVADATAGIKVRADYHDAEDDGFATGLSNCITKDGQTIITQNIPFNSKRATGLEDPVNPQDAATKAYTDNKVANPGTVTGDMTITKDSPSVVLNSTGATGASGIQGSKNGLIRWLLRLGNGEAESGSNAGSNFDIHRYDDAGNYLGQALTINRATGAWNVSTSMTVNGAMTTGDIYAQRSANTGVIFFGTDGQHHVYFDGARYNLINGPTTVGEPQIGSDAATKTYVDGRTSFPAVQQGGGSGMSANKVYIGWDNAGHLLAQVDGVPQGAIAFQSQLVSGATSGRWVHGGDLVTSSYGNLVWAETSNCVISAFASNWAAGYPIPAMFRFKYMQLLVNGSYVTVAG
jgi:hypothetical protein